MNGRHEQPAGDAPKETPVAAPDERAPEDSAEKTAEPAPRDPPARRWLHGRHASAAVIGVLTLLLGFAIIVQVRANSSGDSLSGLREDDLIGILDNQNARSDRLRRQITDLEDTLQRLQTSGDKSAAARQQAREEAQALGVLLGTLPATGPGIVVTVTDPDDALTGEDLLDVVEELRGAGAEAIQFGTVRVSTTTSFAGDKGDVTVDGSEQKAPYRVLAIGDPDTLDTALNIPGGIAAAVRTAGGELSVTQRDTVTISVTRTLPAPKHARPK